MSITVFTDGAARGNPGPSAIAFCVYRDGILIKKFCQKSGFATNNTAEYKAAIAALTYLEEQMPDNLAVTIKSDSELMVKQITGQYKVKDPSLKVLNNLLREKINKLQDSKVIVEFVSIPRAENRLADSLANQALDNQA